MKNFQAIAPGRLCLFGEHQDYLNLPVIALAIPLRVIIDVSPDNIEEPITEAPAQASATERDCTSRKRNRVLRLHVPQLDQVFHYDLDNLPPRQTSTENADFALAAIHEAIHHDGWEIPCGAECISTTNIVMQAGCSSSTAFTTAWILVLAKLSGIDLSEDRLRLAQLAYKAEVLHFSAPGGTMDHVSIALGETCLRIGPNKWEFERLKPLGSQDGVWILADSGDVKDTMGHLKRCKNDRLDLLREKLDGDWDADITGKELNSEQMGLLKATLTNRDCEAEAARLWLSTSKEPNVNSSVGKELGALMLRHHEALRDGLRLSTPRLEAMREAAMKNGAWGFKLVGSGGGGYAVAWASTELANTVAGAMRDAGAKSSWVIHKPCHGARVNDCI